MCWQFYANLDRFIQGVSSCEMANEKEKKIARRAVGFSCEWLELIPLGSFGDEVRGTAHKQMPRCETKAKQRSD